MRQIHRSAQEREPWSAAIARAPIATRNRAPWMTLGSAERQQASPSTVARKNARAVSPRRSPAVTGGPRTPRTS